MEYLIGGYRLRTAGPYNDLVLAGLTGFEPFEVEHGPNDEVVLLVSFGFEVKSYKEKMMTHIYHFDFEQGYGTCDLVRTPVGYQIIMKRYDGKTYHLEKRFTWNEATTDFGCDGQPDLTFLRFALWMVFGMAIAPQGGIAIHSSAIIKDDAALLCLGESGTGKSTHTRLWRKHIEGAHLLNDDSPIVRIVDGVPTAYGSPWSGKTACYINKSYPIRGFMRLSQAPHNKIRRLKTLFALGALLPSCPPAFAHDAELEDAICNTLSQLIAAVPVYHLECLPDAAAAELSYKTVYGTDEQNDR